MAEPDKPKEEGKISKFIHEIEEGASKYYRDVKGVIGIFTQAGEEAKYIQENKAPMVEKAAQKAPPPKGPGM